MTRESVGVDGGRPSCRDVADALRERIRAGGLKAGDPMPTQSRLAVEFGVERGTVRQALRVLQDEGLLTDVTRGAPARIALPAQAAPAEPEAPQPTMIGLGPRIVEAFSAPEVRIDVLSLTTETLQPALGEPLRLIHEGRIKPEKVEVRVLLPSRNIELAFPTPVGGAATDNSVHDYWLRLRNTHGQVLRHNLLALRRSHGIDVTVEFRALPFTPLVKLYLLNGSEALIGFYTLTKREEDIEDTTVELFDALGTQALLFPFDIGTGSRDGVFVSEAQKWFDALWNTISSELTLFP
ncbi:winged helix-turn-helix domain-containing protein [Streptomyces sp. NPDC002994]|uniref:winged helix-turn-helix domain-containing protein n=1 Tax=Streptomyces sp. NPDC002994 TaxID=3154441 RepID=UPI0033B4F862